MNHLKAAKIAKNKARALELVTEVESIKKQAKSLEPKFWARKRALLNKAKELRQWIKQLEADR